LFLQKDWTPQWSSLVAIQPAGSKPPFSASMRAAATCSSITISHVIWERTKPFYALQSQGLDGTRPPHTRVEDMAAHYLKEMREIHHMDRTSSVVDHSVGTIAFEVARQLRALGEEVAWLALLDSYPAGYAALTQESSTPRGKTARIGRRIKSHVANLGTLSFKRRCHTLFEKAQYGPCISGPGVAPESIARMKRMSRACHAPFATSESSTHWPRETMFRRSTRADYIVLGQP